MNCVYTNRLCVSEPTVTHHFGRSEQNLEKPIFSTGFCSLNSSYSSWRLHRRNLFCLCTFFLMVTKSFLPGIKRECASYHEFLFNSRACLMRYSETPKYDAAFTIDQDSVVRVRIFFPLFRCSTSQCFFFSYLLCQPFRSLAFSSFLQLHVS